MSSTSKTCFVGIAISEYCYHYYYAVFHHCALSLSVPEPDVLTNLSFVASSNVLEGPYTAFSFGWREV